MTASVPHPMKKAILPAALAAVCLVALAGCPGTPQAKIDKEKDKAGDKGAKGGGLTYAIDVLRQGNDIPHYRDALHLFNAHFQASPEIRDRLALPEAAR